MNGNVPVAGMILMLGVDCFMSEARTITNYLGNTVATIFVAWTGAAWTWFGCARRLTS